MRYEGWMKNCVPDIHIQLNGASGKWDAVLCYCPDSVGQDMESRDLKVSIERFPTIEEIKAAVEMKVNSR